MKIIHTADWHLCDRLGRIDRTADLRQRVERVAELCEEKKADVLVIAGDLFSEQATLDNMTAALTHMRETFRPMFARGGSILAITGNHDRDNKINMIRGGMTLASPVVGQDGTLTGGRMYLSNGRGLVTLPGADGKRVQFVLVPYPFACRYNISAEQYRTKEEEHRLLHTIVMEWVRDVVKKSEFDPKLPTVLVAHLHVRGSELEHTRFVLTDREDVLMDYADLNPGWAYVALGHIHKPQQVSGMPNMRYPGSLDRLDFGETHEEHGVLFLEVDGAKPVNPVPLPIPATPFHTIVLGDPESELATLAEKYSDREQAIVRITVAPHAGGPSRDEISRELRRIFPRIHELCWPAAEPVGEERPAAITPGLDFAPTVRDYLTRKLADTNDPDAAEVMALADTFLSAEGQS